MTSTASTTAEQHVGTTSMWDAYVPTEIGEKLDELATLPSFVVVSATIRENVATEYGPRAAADLYLATTEAGVSRLYSGFAAGLVGQLRRMSAGDLPAVCNLVEQPTTRTPTKVLGLIKRLEAGSDVAAIAAAQPVPVVPKPYNPDTVPIPYQ